MKYRVLFQHWVIKMSFCVILIPGLSISQSQPLTLQQLLPSHTSNHQIIEHSAYILEYNETYEHAEWVIHLLTKDRVAGSFKRTDNFRPDPKVKTGSASLADYKGSGYDRGHLAPAADMNWSKNVMSESFFMSNMSPQKPGFNRGIWKNLESIVRTWAIENDEIYIVTGPVLSDNLSAIGTNKVAIPEYYYKIILDYKEPEIKGIGFVLPNESSKISLNKYAVTIDSIETLVGIDFFPVLEDNLEENIESRIELNKWAFKNTRQTNNKINTAKPAIPLPAIPSNNEIIVYVTASGKKYHMETCSYLRSSGTPLSLQEAKARGLEPGSRCNPPQ